MTNIYDALAKTAKVDREDVKRVLLAYAFSNPLEKERVEACLSA